MSWWKLTYPYDTLLDCRIDFGTFSEQKSFSYCVQIFGNHFKYCKLMRSTNFRLSTRWKGFKKSQVRLLKRLTRNGFKRCTASRSMLLSKPSATQPIREVQIPAGFYSSRHVTISIFIVDPMIRCHIGRSDFGIVDLRNFFDFPSSLHFSIALWTLNW